MKNKTIELSPSAEDRILELKSKPENKDKHLRITVFGGGCNGMRYEFSLDDKINEDDFKVVNGNKTTLVVDDMSLGFIDGGVVDFTRDLGSSYFKIINPIAKSSCGCGDSFSV
ncbi:MAG: iron-sulfur cluster insertion protein [Rickettsiales bacterium]|jgi:iron-sulfur cluster insertion protein